MNAIFIKIIHVDIDSKCNLKPKGHRIDWCIWNDFIDVFEKSTFIEWTQYDNKTQATFHFFVEIVYLANSLQLYIENIFEIGENTNSWIYENVMFLKL